MGIDTSKGVLRIQDRCHGNSTAKDANPCDLAQTRAWVEDYKRWVAGDRIRSSDGTVAGGSAAKGSSERGDQCVGCERR